jgi:hypothetical protein
MCWCVRSGEAGTIPGPEALAWVEEWVGEGARGGEDMKTIEKAASASENRRYDLADA